MIVEFVPVRLKFNFPAAIVADTPSNSDWDNGQRYQFETLCTVENS